MLSNLHQLKRFLSWNHGGLLTSLHDFFLDTLITLDQMFILPHGMCPVFQRPILLYQALEVFFLFITFSLSLLELLKRYVLLLLDELFKEYLLRPLQYQRLVEVLRDDGVLASLDRW